MTQPLVRVICSQGGCTHRLATVTAYGSGAVLFQEIPRKLRMPQPAGDARVAPLDDDDDSYPLLATPNFEVIRLGRPVEVAPWCRCPKHGRRQVPADDLGSALVRARNRSVPKAVTIKTVPMLD